jgi:hypothetical protein
MTREAWFKQNQMPATWQGWATVIAFFAFVLGLFAMLGAGLSKPLGVTIGVLGAVVYTGIIFRHAAKKPSGWIWRRIERE